jgi:hypothetical protein
MATTAQMIAGGIAFVVNTVLLAYFAYVGDKVFQPILKWYYSFQYPSAPPFDPGLITWCYGIFFVMLIAMWFGLLFAFYQVAISKATYGYGEP